MPVISDHSTTVFDCPRNVTMRLFVLFLACSASVAHLQLSGEYEPLTSIRSIECFFEGGYPISSRKFSYDVSHRSQTVMPRAPYHLNAVQLESLHRCRIDTHMLCSIVPFSPCLAVARPLAADVSLMRHPQLRVPKLAVRIATRRSCEETSAAFPHEHWQFQWAPFCLSIGSIPANETIVSRPIVCPVRFRNRACVGRVTSVMASPSVQGGYGSAA